RDRMLETSPNPHPDLLPSDGRRRICRRLGRMLAMAHSHRHCPCSTHTKCTHGESCEVVGRDFDPCVADLPSPVGRERVRVRANVTESIGWTRHALAPWDAAMGLLYVVGTSYR